MSGIAGLAPIPMYLAITKNESAYVAKTAKTDPAGQAAVAYFQKQAPTITSPDALLKDYRSLQVVLGAFGMSGQIGETGLLKDLMTQNPSDPKSFAQQSANPVYQRFAQFMSNWTTSPLANAKTVQTIVSQYQTNQFEQAQGQQMPGMQQALYFARTISSATSIDAIMSDPTLLNVVETVTGQPVQFGLLGFTQQQAILTKAVDVTKFQNPAYVKQYVEHYLALTQENPPASNAPATVLDLFGAGSSSGGTLSLLA